MSKLKQQVSELLARQQNIMTIQIAEQLKCPEGEILCALPDEFVRIFPASRTQDILEQISQWGIFTLVIEKEGFLFEIKDQFPMGSLGYGYYNLNMKGDQGTIYGHLKLENVAKIAFISLPFRGKESYNIAFIASNGQVICKLYLGRDSQRQLFPEQIEKFKNFQ